MDLDDDLEQGFALLNQLREEESEIITKSVRQGLPLALTTTAPNLAAGRLNQYQQRPNPIQPIMGVNTIYQRNDHHQQQQQQQHPHHHHHTPSASSSSSLSLPPQTLSFGLEYYPPSLPTPNLQSSMGTNNVIGNAGISHNNLNTTNLTTTPNNTTTNHHTSNHFSAMPTTQGHELSAFKRDRLLSLTPTASAPSTATSTQVNTSTTMIGKIGGTVQQQQQQQQQLQSALKYTLPQSRIEIQSTLHAALKSINPTHQPTMGVNTLANRTANIGGKGDYTSTNNNNNTNNMKNDLANHHTPNQTPSSTPLHRAHTPSSSTSTSSSTTTTATASTINTGLLSIVGAIAQKRQQLHDALITLAAVEEEYNQHNAKIHTNNIIVAQMERDVTLSNAKLFLNRISPDEESFLNQLYSDKSKYQIELDFIEGQIQDVEIDQEVAVERYNGLLEQINKLNLDVTQIGEYGADAIKDGAGSTSLMNDSTTTTTTTNTSTPSNGGAGQQSQSTSIPSHIQRRYRYIHYITLLQTLLLLETRINKLVNKLVAITASPNQPSPAILEERKMEMKLLKEKATEVEIKRGMLKQLENEFAVKNKLQQRLALAISKVKGDGGGGKGTGPTLPQYQLAKGQGVQQQQQPQPHQHGPRKMVRR